MKQNKIVKLSERTHVLKRSARYLGSIVPQTVHRPIIENNKIVFRDIQYVFAFLKIIREFLDNSIDEYVRTSGKFANEIKINIDDKKVIIQDNGRGIPVKSAYDEQGNELPETMPELAWANLRAGSNFEDNEDDTQIGQNGEGASLGVIFAKKFIGETDDGEKYFKIIAKNNLEEKDIEIIESKGIQGTKITYYPDLEKLNLGDSIDPIYIDLLKFELLYLAITYPQINFKLNNRLIKTRTFAQLNKEYFDNKIVFAQEDNIIIGISPSEEGYKFIQFVNGINTFNGGKTLEYVEKRVFEPLVARFQKRYKKIKQSDIMNKVCLHVVFSGMPKPRFGDQIKSSCINTASQFPEISKQVLEITKGRFIEKIYKTKEITEPIIDLFKAQQLIEEQKIAKKNTKKKRELPKYWKPSKDYNYLFLSEGDSAIGSIISGVGRGDKGYFPLKGKIINAIKKPLSVISKNDEIQNIADIVGMDFDPNQKDFKYSNVVLATDADLDGIHISALLLSFFYKYAPELLKQGRIFRFITPIVILYKGEDIYKFLFTLDELQDFESKNKNKSIKYKYTKGLGSLSEIEWEILFERYKFEDLLERIVISSEEDFKKLLLWMDEDRDYRKTVIKENIYKMKLDFA